MDRLRLVIAEDDAQIRDCLCLALAPEYEILGALDNGADVLQMLQQVPADVLVLDISLPGLSGLKVAQRLRQAGNATRIILLTGHADRAYIEESKRIGVEGYVLKGRALNQLMLAIDEVSHGHSYISPELRQSAAFV